MKIEKGMIKTVKKYRKYFPTAMLGGALFVLFGAFLMLSSGGARSEAEADRPVAWTQQIGAGKSVPACISSTPNMVCNPDGTNTVTVSWTLGPNEAPPWDCQVAYAYATSSQSTKTIAPCSAAGSIEFYGVPSNTNFTQRVYFYGVFEGYANGNPWTEGGSYEYTTLNCPQPTPPSQPINVVGSCPVPGTTFTLNYANGGGTPTRYEVSTSVNGTWTSNGLNTSYQFGTTAGNTYSAQARACNAAGCSAAVSTGNVTCTPPVPTATLSANPSTIDRGQSSNLFWSSTNATSCVSAGGFSTGNATVNPPGGVSTGALTQTSTYQVTCSGIGGTSAPAQATVTVLTPSVSISTNLPRVNTGSGNNTVTVSWTATNVNSCTITRNGAAWKNLTADGSRTVTGSQNDTITTQTAYEMNCENDSGQLDEPVTTVVNVTSGFQEF